MKKTIQILILLVFTIQGYSQEYNRWFIEKANGNLGFIDSLGNEIFSDKFDLLCEHYHSGLVSFKKQTTFGYLDIDGNIIFTTDDYFGIFSDGLLLVEDESIFYFLDTLGQKVIDLKELEIPNGKEIFRACNFYDGLALVILKDNLSDNDLTYGFIDKTGKWFLEPKFQHATSFVEGIACVLEENKNYFIDTQGNHIAQLDNKNGEIWNSGDDNLFDFAEDFAVVYFKDSIGFSTSFINRKGERVSSLMFRRANKFSDGMASVQLNDKWGFIDTTGNIAIQPQYDVRSDFSEGVAPVYISIEDAGYMFNSYSAQGFIDKTGATVIPFQPHVSYGGFKNGLTKGRRFIYKNKKYIGKYEFFYMNKKGEKIWSEIVKQ